MTRESTKLRWWTVIAICFAIAALFQAYKAGPDVLIAIGCTIACTVLIAHIKRRLGFYGTITLLAMTEEAARVTGLECYHHTPKGICQGCGQYYGNHKKIGKGKNETIACPEPKKGGRK